VVWLLRQSNKNANSQEAKILVHNGIDEENVLEGQVAV
jgi:hypothetical protein